MTNENKLLEKLEQRFINGEISEEIYRELKEGLIATKAERDTSHGVVKRSEKVSISGAGKLAGPIYTERLSVSGAGKVSGDVDAIEVKASGSLKIDGNVKAKEVRTSGALSVTGNVDTEIFKNSGGGKISGDLHAFEVHSSGSTKVVGAIVAKDIVKSSGSIHTESIDAKEVAITGAFEVSNYIKADEIRISLAGTSNAKFVEGINIDIRPGNGTVRFFGINFHSSGAQIAKIDEIKGDRIVLENVKARSVNGNDVDIGPGCVIEVLKARSSRIHEEATVKSRMKLK